MALRVVLDYSFLRDLTSNDCPEKKRKDLDYIIDLGSRGIINIEMSFFTWKNAQQMENPERQILEKRLGKSLKPWPCLSDRYKGIEEIQELKRCLARFLRGLARVTEDLHPENLVEWRFHGDYVITTNDHFVTWFRTRAEILQDECKFTMKVLTPAEFREKHESGQL